MTNLTEQKEKKRKVIILRVSKSLLNCVEEKAKEFKTSMNGYISFVLNRSVQKQEETLFEEALYKPQKKEIKSSVYLTKSEAELLKHYAQANDWSVPRELRYRVVSTLSQKPKLSGEELKAIYSVRSSINTLGANINRLIINDQVLCDHNITVCKELLELIKELLSKIKYLEKCSNSHFKLKEIGSTNGS